MWRNRPMVGFDTETTGTDPESCSIVSACVGVAGVAGAGWAPRNFLLTQAEPIPEAATAIHGITTEYANASGTDPKVALLGIVADLYEGWASGMVVVGFNIVYDLTVLDRNLRRHGLDPLQVRGPVVDPLVIDKAVDPYRRGSRKLVDVARRYGMTLDEEDAHCAEADALVSCRIAWHLAGRQDVPDDPQRLHDAQVCWYADQRRSFAAYLAKRGKALDDPNTVWPLKPLPDAVPAVA